MKTPRHERPTPWLNRRDQYRMLALVGLLCLVMVAIQLSARPSSWYWLLPPGQAGAPVDAAVTLVPLEELDFRVKEEPREALPPDVFRAVADDSPSADAAQDGDTVADQQLEDSPAVQGGEGDDLPDARLADDASIAPVELSAIEDNTVGIRRAEVEAYHEMLAKVRSLPEDVRRQQTRDDVAFTVIMLQPEDYRGKLVGITGHLHRLGKLPVMANEAGIDRLYEGWMFTDDSGNHPWRFVCTSLPDGSDPESLSQSLPRRVHVEGYFFKRMGYASEGGQHVAPLLLADSFEVLPVPVSNVPQIQGQMRNWMLAILGLVIVVLGVTFWWFAASDRRYVGSRLHELAVSRLDADPQALEALAEMDLADPAQPFADPTHADPTHTKT